MSQILDQFGRPAVAYGSPSTGLMESTEDSTYRASRPRLDYDIATLLPRVKHRALISDSRWIRTAFPVVGGAIEQKADYVCGAGWSAKFTGQDIEWGNRAEKALLQADALCDLRGFPFSFDKNMRLGSTSFDADGDYFIYKTERRDLPGYPAFQFLEAHRFGSCYSWAGRVQGGAYDGARIINGIIYDDAAAPIAYNLLGQYGQPDRQISARDIVHAFDPRWFSEGRSLPTVAYAVLDWYDVKETRDGEKIAQKANAALAIVEKNATGQRPINNVVGTTQTTTPAGLQTELMEKGLIRYIKSGSGEITAHTSNRPSDGAQRFEDTLLAGAFYGMGWRREMMDLSKLTGAGVRGFADNINKAIVSRWDVLASIAHLLRIYQVSKLIERGDLPEHPEWDQWGHAQPPTFTVDAQRTSQTDRDNVRAGVESMPAVIRRTGRDAEDVLREQAKYLRLRKKVAKEMKVSEIELGTLSLPGDQVAPTAQGGASPTDDLEMDQRNSDNLEENDSMDTPPRTTAARASTGPLPSLDQQKTLREYFETYGTAVRSGVITPNIEDEKAVRVKLSLPVVSADVVKAWEDDGGSRKPITLKSQNESLASTAAIDPTAQPAPDQP